MTTECRPRTVHRIDSVPIGPTQKVGYNPEVNIGSVIFHRPITMDCLSHETTRGLRYQNLAGVHMQRTRPPGFHEPPKMFKGLRLSVASAIRCDLSFSVAGNARRNVPASPE